MTLILEKETEAELPFDYEELAQNVTGAVMDYFHCPYDYAVNVYVKDAAEIKEINASFRCIDRVTDVLSFPNVSFEKEADFSFLEAEETTYDCFDPDSGELVLGDILICQERMLEQASEYGHSPQREYAFLLAHSLLHLLGFDHEKDDERIRMEHLQEEILTSLGITRE